MIDTTREQDTVIEALATAWGAVAVEPVQPDETVRVIGAVPDAVTPLALVLNADGTIVGGGAAGPTRRGGTG